MGNSFSKRISAFSHSTRKRFPLPIPSCRLLFNLPLKVHVPNYPIPRAKFNPSLRVWHSAYLSNIKMLVFWTASCVIIPIFNECSIVPVYQIISCNIESLSRKISMSRNWIYSKFKFVIYKLLNLLMHIIFHKFKYRNDSIYTKTFRMLKKE